MEREQCCISRTSYWWCAQRTGRETSRSRCTVCPTCSKQYQRHKAQHKSDRNSRLASISSRRPESTGRANSGQLRLWPHELLLQRDWFEHSSHSYPSNSHRQCTALTRFLNCSCRSPACHVFVYVTYTHNLIYFEILMPIDFEFVQNCLLHSYAPMRDRRLWHVQQLFQLLNAEAVKSLPIIKMFLFLACENSLYCKCTVQLLNLNKHLFFQLRLPEKCRAQASALRAIHSSSVSTSELW